MKRTTLLVVTMLSLLGWINQSFAGPTNIAIDVSSLSGQDFQLEFALYDNSGTVGDTWVLLDEILFGSAWEDFESGTTGNFDISLNPDSVSVIEGTLTGSGSYVLRIDEDPVYTPTFTWADFSGSSSGLISFVYDIVASVNAGFFGLDELVISILDPDTLEPLVPGLIQSFGDVMAEDSEGLQTQENYTVNYSSSLGGSVTTPGEGDYVYIQYDNPAYTTVPITAAPEQYYHFVEWTGTAVDAGKVANALSVSTTVSVDADYTLVANFEIDEYVVKLSSSVGGSVTSLGEGDFICYGGQEIKLEAKADPMFEFLRWQGTLTSSSNPYQYLTIANDHDIRAIFQSTLDVLYVDDNAPNDAGPYSLSVSDPDENGTKDHPFDSIQEAIEVAKPGSTLVVLPGTYSESLLLRSKAIAVTSTDPDSNEPVLEYPVIQAPDDEPVVSFQFCTDPTMVLEGLVLTGANDNSASGIKSLRSDVVIKNCLIAGNRRRTSGSAGGGALSCSHSEVTLINCTLTENYGGINGAGIYANSTSTVTVMDSILWGNQPTETLTDASSVVTVTTSDVTGSYAGTGNLDVDPAFVAPGYWEHALNPGMVVLPSHSYAVWVSGDYHLTEGSSCIDAGDPLSGYGLEPEPNGGQVNMGAYGNTPQATMTPTP